MTKTQKEYQRNYQKTSPLSFDEQIGKIKETQRGWLNYFRGANILTKLRDLDGWVRNRLRYCIWHDYERAIPQGKCPVDILSERTAGGRVSQPERKRKNLMRLGVDYHHAYAWND